MPLPKDSPQPALIAGCAPPAKRRSAFSWSGEELAFADSLITEWNKAFRPPLGTSANVTRRNRFAAVHLHRWLQGPDNSHSSHSSHSPAPMTDEDVRIAIRAYSEDPWIIKQCQGRFACFGDWLRACPDAVDKQLNRLGKPRGSQPLPPETPAARRARELLAHLGLGDLARHAARGGDSIADYVSFQVRSLEQRSGERYRESLDHARRVSALLAAFTAATDGLRVSLSGRAATGFHHLYGRPVDGSLEDCNLVEALALALFDRERRPSTPSTSSMKGGHP